MSTSFVCFQKMERKHRNGEIVKYVLRTETVTAECFELDTSCDMSINNDDSYWVDVEAATVEGNSPPVRIYVPGRSRCKSNYKDVYI
jgi:hypothetical protein